MAAAEQHVLDVESTGIMENAPTPAYLRVVRFDSVAEMRAVSAEVVTLLHQHIGDRRNLSSYAIEVDRVPYVVVMGQRPMFALAGNLTTTLARGTPADLPLEVITRLLGESHRVRKQGPWVHERHRPGREIP